MNLEEMEEAIKELKEHWTRQQEEIDHLLRMNDSGGEKELPKDENGLNHIHGTGVGNLPTDSKPPEPIGILPKEDSEKKKCTGTDYKIPYIILQKEAFDDSDEFPFEVEQCYKCLNLHNKCNDCDDFEHYKEDSGGEKVRSAAHTEKKEEGWSFPDKKEKVFGKIIDEKPPEDKPLIIKMDEDVIFDLREPIEPREDLYFCRLCGNEITDVEHEISKLTKEVKGEDLERLFFVLDWELNMDTLTHKDYKYINKFKEEYGIE